MKNIARTGLILCLPLLAGQAQAQSKAQPQAQSQAPAQAENIMSIMARQADGPRLSPNTIPYSYTMAINLKSREGKDRSEAQAVLRVDPTRPAGRRVRILSYTDIGNEGLQDFIKGLEDPENTMVKQAEEFWCGPSETEAEIDFGPEDYTVISETDTEAVLRPDMMKFGELMMQAEGEDVDGLEKKMMKKLFKRLDGEMTLSKPRADVTSFSMHMTRPLTFLVVAKIKAMNVDATCAQAPNGHYYQQSMKMHVKAKALGISIEEDMTVQISELSYLP